MTLRYHVLYFQIQLCRYFTQYLRYVGYIQDFVLFSRYSIQSIIFSPIVQRTGVRK